MRSSMYGGPLLSMSGGDVSITNIIIDGNSAHVGAGNSLINITNAGSVLNIESGAVLQNNLSGMGGAIYANAGMINLNGGTIQNNIASTNLTSSSQHAYGGAICLDGGGALIMNSGLITNNQATSHINAGSAYGGAIYAKIGSIEMSGGTISNNTAYGGQIPARGGAVYVGDVEGGSGIDSEMTMEGGTITGNTATDGGGVYVAAHGEFIMHGGAITNNTAQTSVPANTPMGGGVYAEANTELACDSGTISGNTASLGQGVYVEDIMMVAPDSGLDIVDVIYLTDGAYISIGSELDGIASSLTIQCESPAADLVVAEGDGYDIDPFNDLSYFAYIDDLWGFDLNGDNQIVLASTR
jgi:hypothetical protein